MPIDVEKALNAVLPDVPSSWESKDVILYHLGLGAGVPSGDANELEYTYEPNLKVLPTWAVIPCFDFFAHFGDIPGLDINFAMVLHGEQELEVHSPIPTSAKVVNRGRVTGIYDKGKAALIVLEIDTIHEDGTKLFTNRMSIFARGEGGFGGESGPKVVIDLPSREPDHVVESPVLPQQALIYRLSGDWNPLHADPEYAKLGGFDRPILHGLCTYGVVAKAVVDAALDGEVTRIKAFRTRFAGVVYPGETIVTRMWDTEGGVVVDVTTKERGETVLSNCLVEVA